MKLGIISDTHDNQEATKKAVEFFKNREIKTLIHAGDIIAPFTAKLLKDFEIYAVFGNNDGERFLLSRTINIKDFQYIEIANRRIAVYHGTLENITEALIKSEEYDVVVTGHTHRALIEKHGKTLHINPGEACGYLTNKRTIAILDLEKMSAEIFEL